MFLEKYLDEFYYELILDSYKTGYLNMLDENNFIKIYSLFKEYKFYFINDIILKYLEIFDVDCNEVNKTIIQLKNKLGDKFIYIIGNNMSYLNEILNND